MHHLRLACPAWNGERVMHFRDINEAVRAGIVEEVRFDIARGALYKSERLSFLTFHAPRLLRLPIACV
jgi:hypothetical protein